MSNSDSQNSCTYFLQNVSYEKLNYIFQRCKILLCKYKFYNLKYCCWKEQYFRDKVMSLDIFVYFFLKKNVLLYKLFRPAVFDDLDIPRYMDSKKYVYKKCVSVRPDSGFLYIYSLNCITGKCMKLLLELNQIFCVPLVMVSKFSLSL